MLDMSQARAELHTTGGFSRWITEGFNPESGYIVSRSDYMPSLTHDKTHGQAINMSCGVAHRVATALQTLSDDKKLGKNYASGAWTDSKENLVYIDVSQHFESLDEAINLAKELGELAIWDITNKKEIEI